MTNALRNYFMAVEQGQRIAAADAERAQKLQVDSTFWDGIDAPNRFKIFPLWQAICIFKGMNPSHWALTSPAYAERMQRHTTGDVAERLKEMLRLHGKAMGHAETKKLKGFFEAPVGFKTDIYYLSKWAGSVREAVPNFKKVKPLFIPLKREYFEAFKSGAKTEEFRPEGPRWNARTCAVGRPVVLSLGYGKANRLSGVVTGYRASKEPTTTPAWRDCYGDRMGLAACVQIKLEGSAV